MPTTNPPAAPTTTVSADVDHDQLRRLENELAAEPPHRLQWRSVHCTGEIHITGLPVMCGQCAARRDWLIIRMRGNVYIRCRCGHSWHEPEITTQDFESLIGPDRTVYDTLDKAIRDAGYDGLLAGAWLPFE